MEMKRTGWLVFSDFVQEKQTDSDSGNRECEVEHLQRAVVFGVADFLEETDDQDHDNDLGDLVFELIERVDGQDFALFALLVFCGIDL